MSKRAEDHSLFLYEGRYRRGVRLLALAVISGGTFIGNPHPTWSGHGLVILISLVVTVASQLANTFFAPGPGALARTIIGAVGGGVLAGYDPSVGTAVLLIFVGLDIGANLDFAPGGLVTALAVLTTAMAVLASGEATSNVSLGSVAIVGFAATNGRKQYVLRAEEAELRLADAERAREEHARAVALAERANAAREIHDILAHTLGALVLQLDALDALLGSETPDHQRAVQLLARSRSLAVDGLSEARRAVGTLRQDAPPLVDSLHQLVDTVGAGTLEIVGTPRSTSGEVAVALRRTAQEGLTNAAKHAPGTTPTVQLEFAPGEIILTVSDTGRPDGVAPVPLAETGGGYGLEGLRERAKLIGGTLVAGPHGEGWLVSLSVPDQAPSAPSIPSTSTTAETETTETATT